MASTAARSFQREFCWPQIVGALRRPRFGHWQWANRAHRRGHIVWTGVWRGADWRLLGDDGARHQFLLERDQRPLQQRDRPWGRNRGRIHRPDGSSIWLFERSVGNARDGACLLTVHVVAHQLRQAPAPVRSDQRGVDLRRNPVLTESPRPAAVLTRFSSPFRLWTGLDRCSVT